MIAQARPLHAFETEDPILARKPMRERKRRPSVASVIRQMQRAGVEQPEAAK